MAFAKRALPLLAVGLLAVMALWPEIESNAERGRVAFRRVAEVRPDALHVVEPRYQGVDEQNRPFTVTATSAVQQGQAEIVQLLAPRADITLTDGGWVYLEADRGRYAKPEERLDLAGRVTVHHDDGTQFVTESATLDLHGGNAAGDVPVAAQGPFGTLTADAGFRLQDRGQVVQFLGNSRVVLESAQTSGNGPEGGE
ncbi:LPS export ABC transporter periplasmic protein LptC [Falsiroseomonas sp. HW251]|uniref:LPS export ABC transporter periplasmic protein LptC n=1 Tax=Falsiroseomonas sp. HW251 TaxID=3390998 RepID=UPI003D31E494